MFQIHLNGKGMSQRYVRYEVLSMAEVEAAELAAAKQVTPQSLQSEFNSIVEKEGIEMMVREVSEPGENPQKWKKVNAELLHGEWKKFFGLKDTIALKAVYRKEHNITEKELEAIMEKKVDVLED